MIEPLGSVTRISIAEATMTELQMLDEIEAIADFGLAGDRHAGNPARQVSIQSQAELNTASQRLGRPIDCDLSRRNITLDRGALPRTRGQRLWLGEAELEVFADAAPCSLMTAQFGDGAREALKRLAGIHCRVFTGAMIRIGDQLRLPE